MAETLFSKAFGVEKCLKQDWSSLFGEFFPEIQNVNGMN